MTIDWRGVWCATQVLLRILLGVLALLAWIGLGLWLWAMPGLWSVAGWWLWSFVSMIVAWSVWEGHIRFGDWARKVEHIPPTGGSSVQPPRREG